MADTRTRARAQVKPQMLSNLMWALATLQVAPQPLLAALAAEVQRQLPAFKPQARLPRLWHALIRYRFRTHTDALAPAHAVSELSQAYLELAAAP